MYFLVWGLSALVVSYAGVAAIRHWALRRNLLDIPNERSSHVTPTPRGGGLAIVAVVLTGLGLSQLFASNLDLKPLAGYLAGACILIAISIAEDLWHVSPKLRLMFHALAAVVFIIGTGYVNQIYLPFLGTWNLEPETWNLKLGTWNLGFPLTLFWIVGLTNVYNFMDGIDGIAAGQAIVASVFWLIVSLALGMSTLSGLSTLLIGANLGFLLHNTPPARIFMGDVGSTFLGFSFAAMPILALAIRDTQYAIGDSRFFLAGVLCVAPFVFDSSLTIARRIRNRENIFKPHRSHLYQRLVQLGHPHAPVSGLYTALAALTSLLGLVYIWGDDLYSGLALLAVIVLLLAVAISVAWLEHREEASRANLDNTSASALARKF